MEKESSRLEMLDEASLTRQPEEVFDILSKLGEGSYGSVFKALHKDSKQILAIKQVPVDTDLQEIIKEISIMQQCDSPYVVKYYGSYFKNTDLWIVMEYCGAGSVSDIMRLRKKTLSEDEIGTILCDTLKGLEYLHLRKKIHRDIKAGNILLNSEGHAKLADFGVAGQLTDTMAKRNTVIGTPFWMAPEVIQEIGYDCVADIWSLGITALEMAEGKPPYGDIHPMRAIFMIPSKPPPTFRDSDRWSPQFIDLVSRCLVKTPEKRATASELLHSDFIVNAKSCQILHGIILEAAEIRDNQLDSLDEDNADSGTMLPGDQGTLISISDGTFVNHPTNPEYDGTMLQYGDGTMVQHGTGSMIGVEGGTMVQHDTGPGSAISRTMSGIDSNLGTMVINEEEEDSTMKQYGTAPGGSKYRPEFLDHFDKKENDEEKKIRPEPESKPKPAPVVVEEKSPQLEIAKQNLQRQLQQIAGQNLSVAMSQPLNPLSSDKFQRSINEGDFEFLKFLPFDELSMRMSGLDSEMEKEIEDLRRRYNAKRQPILDAMDQKRKRQQNF
ncbi:serine/threonine-protein kinase 3 [Eurytemora carolleeae]|uniref:serine/threonine-protein kinase 3 n=1 Tax=Eurytemora carolleeae TaxID=1294199 RepID=UPI000C77EC19|nr:serine/threonine-protein kinase 3 [Eurytemora carolleeae]|eukprot:XP_023339413.1 serine/threonine-protein kinase 3-like [Eurytemora affinis]